jgi:adenylate cyclase
VPIFEAVCLREHLTPQVAECIDLFEQGMAKYYARDWDGALALFARSRGLEANVPGQSPGVSNNPSMIYIEIATHYREDPPAGNWDGVYVMKEK